MSRYLITTNTEVPDGSIKATIVCQDGFIETRKSIQTLLYPWLQDDGPDMCCGSCNILMIPDSKVKTVQYLVVIFNNLQPFSYFSHFIDFLKGNQIIAP